MHFIRSIQREAVDFVAENMGKDMSLEGKSVKQWGGAHVFTNSFTNMHFNVSLTGGVPTAPLPEDIYQVNRKLVANRFNQKFRSVQKP